MLNIAIDGPAGAGKSTIAKRVAKELGILYVDTGSMYRAMALACIRQEIRAEEEERVCKLCERLEISLQYEENQQIVLLNGEKVNAYIRTEEVGNMTSAIAVYQPVRNKLVQLQRKMAKEQDLIMDGRDIGTCVLQNATLKIYLTASTKTRAQRRYQELLEKGATCQLEEIEKDIKERDYRDMHREVSPLTQAEDAVCIDSSEMTIEEVVALIIKLVKEKQ